MRHRRGRVLHPNLYITTREGVACVLQETHTAERGTLGTYTVAALLLFPSDLPLPPAASPCSRAAVRRNVEMKVRSAVLKMSGRSQANGVPR